MKTPTKAMLTNPRRNEAWRFDLLDLQNNLVGELDGVTGGSLDYSIYNTIRSGGTLDYEGDPISWDQHRIRIWYILKHNGQEYGWPLGTFHPTTGNFDHDDGVIGTKITLYDNLLLLDQDGLSVAYAVKAGTLVTDAIETVVTGGLAHSPGFLIDENPATVRNDLVWEPSQENTRLRVANDLAETINHGALTANGLGVFESRWLGSAATRGLVWDFSDNEESIYNVNFIHERDTANVYNKVVGHVDGDEETAGFSAVATDEDPQSPWSFQSRGRWITGTVEAMESATPEALQERVERALRDSQQVASTFEITHDLIPLGLNDAVMFRNSTGGFDVRGVVPSFSVAIDFEGGSEMRTRIREVIS